MGAVWTACKGEFLGDRGLLWPPGFAELPLRTRNLDAIFAHSILTLLEREP
ncbi:MAG TPA: hypothetical protein V6C84_00585 [Coleofasciculaceae cyanobacterium]